ncbi:unnamed protein product, partial [marine sediment metagenome]
MLESEDVDIVNILVERGKHAKIFKDIEKYKKHIEKRKADRRFVLNKLEKGRILQ